MTRIGIIGAGPNAAGHAHYFAKSSRAELVAIADVNLERAQELAQETGARAVGDYRDLLDRVDAVVISSPNFLHHEHAIECARAKKHVYCEKPMGLNLAEARDIEGAVGRAKVASVVGFSNRFGGDVQTMLRLNEAGELGDLISIASRRLCFIDPENTPAWRRDHAQSGGLLFEINIHEIDWMMWLGGEVKSVYARKWSREAGPRHNDHIWITLNFDGGATGAHEGSWLSSNPQFYRSVEGTRAGLCTDEWGTQLFMARRGENRHPHPKDDAFDLRAHFLDCIEDKVQPVADVRWALKVMAVGEAILLSAAQNRVVHMQELF
jgi:predicted dehydrogenase